MTGSAFVQGTISTQKRHSRLPMKKVSSQMETIRLETWFTRPLSCSTSQLPCVVRFYSEPQILPARAAGRAHLIPRHVSSHFAPMRHTPSRPIAPIPRPTLETFGAIRGRTAMAPLALMFCAKPRHSIWNKTFRTGLQIPAGFGGTPRIAQPRRAGKRFYRLPTRNEASTCGKWWASKKTLAHPCGLPNYSKLACLSCEFHGHPATHSTAIRPLIP